MVSFVGAGMEKVVVKCAALGRVESELVGRPSKLVAHATCWLHSMLLHGRKCCCRNL